MSAAGSFYQPRNEDELVILSMLGRMEIDASGRAERDRVSLASVALRDAQERYLQFRREAREAEVNSELTDEGKTRAKQRAARSALEDINYGLLIQNLTQAENGLRRAVAPPDPDFSTGAALVRQEIRARLREDVHDVDRILEHAAENGEFETIAAVVEMPVFFRRELLSEQKEHYIRDIVAEQQSTEQAQELRTVANARRVLSDAVQKIREAINEEGLLKGDRTAQISEE